MNQEDVGNQLNSMMQQFYSGLGNTANANPLISQYYGMANQNLQGQQKRDVGAAANQGYAQASSMNLSNPNSLMQRYVSNTYGQYAPQFGQLQQAQAGAQVQNQNQHYQQMLQLLQMMSGNAQANIPQGFSMGQLVPGLIGAAGKIGAAALTGGASIPMTAMMGLGGAANQYQQNSINNQQPYSYP